jgi:hypothetical protein
LQRNQQQLKTVKTLHAVTMFLALMMAAATGRALDGNDPYSKNCAQALKLGNDLKEDLPNKFQSDLAARPMLLLAQTTPFAVPAAAQTGRQIVFSRGMIDLLNHLCHAKAADKAEPGFFDRYLQEVAAGKTPEITDSKFWTSEVLNHQASYFNQMAGMICALNYSHQYLGHCTKYANVICSPQGDVTSINNFLTQREWKESLRAAALNSLQCALSTEGIQVLFDAINRMPQRPDWTGFIMPQGIDVRSTNQQLSRWEEDFFHGKFQ